MTTDFTKFPEIRKVRQVLLKSQGVLLLKQVLVKEGAVDQLRHPLPQVPLLTCASLEFKSQSSSASLRFSVLKEFTLTLPVTSFCI